jgi:hypothetical protein
MAGSLAAMRKRPAPASDRRIAHHRHRDDEPSLAPAREQWDREVFQWFPGERIDGPPRVTREHFVSEALDDREG